MDPAFNKELDLSTIQETASELGMAQDQLDDEHACYEFVVSNAAHNYQLEIADSWMADQNEQDLEKTEAALSELLSELANHQGYIASNPALAAAVAKGQEAI